VGRGDEGARPVLQRGLEHLQRRDIEVVGRLVEQQAGGAALREHGQLGSRGGVRAAAQCAPQRLMEPSAARDVISTLEPKRSEA
jgi:hypothetical protein